MSHYTRFIKHFTGHRTFQLFGDKKDLPPIIMENPCPLELKKKNNQGYGIFICVNETDGKGRKASNVTRVRAVFADLDGVSPSKMMDDMPHFAVQSSPGKFHGYWLVDEEFPLAGFTGIQKSIAWRYGSDPSVNDLSRVMRVAGFYHLKKEPCPTEVVWVNDTQTKLTYAECVELFPPEPKKKWSGNKVKPISESDFPQPSESITELLEKYGWSFHHGMQWTREGKDHGCSGNIQESGNFFCYTPSTVLEQNKSYDCAGLMIAYEFGGNVKEYVKHIMAKR